MTGLLDRALDRSVLLSFDRHGYARHARRFDRSEDDTDLDGKVVLITGANSGIGKATARALARRRADVWMLCRDSQRATEAMEELQTENPAAKLHFAQMDISEQASIRQAVERIDAPHIDVLVHNAGVLPDERFETADGVELTVATNLVGPFLLTWLLRDRLVAAEQGRIVLVTSGRMYPRKLSVDRLVRPARRFDGVTAYADTKRAMVVLNEQLAARFEGTDVTVHAMHPGWAATPAVKTSLPTFWSVTRSILRTPEEGADTVIWLASADAAAQTSGELWFDRQAVATHAFPWTREGAAERERLWDQLCRWTHIEPDAAWHGGMGPPELTGQIRETDAAP